MTDHRFARPHFWWLKRRMQRWQCVDCGMSTRRYDSADRAATRPVHPAMTVAYPGVNTTRRQ